MRVLLVNPSSSTGFQSWHPPLGLAYISAYAKKYVPNVDVECCDMSIGEALIPHFKRYQPDIIGVTATSMQYPVAKKLGESLRRNGFKGVLVMGGQHITALPTTLPYEYNAGVCGEGEKAFASLLRDWIQGDISKHVPKYYVAPQVQDLDDLPMPDRSIFNMKEYLRDDKFHWVGATGVGTNMMTSRGCLYHCIFCSSSKFWGNPRGHSPKRVIEEMRLLSDTYRIQYLSIWDDLFVYDPQRVKHIADLFEEENFAFKVNVCGAHAPSFTHALARDLKRMNVDYVSFGFETQNPETLKWLKAGVARPEDNLRAIQICKEYGMKVGSGFIYNVPNEKPTDKLMNERFALNTGMDSHSHYILTAYPGSPLWELALRQGKVGVDMDFTTLCQNENGKNVRMTDT